MKQGRTRIERAALSLFATRGIGKTTTREIADKAGLAEGTLYRHFRTKDHLAVSLFVDFSQRFVRRLEAAATGSPEEALRGIVREFFRFAQEEPQAYEYVTHQHPPLRDLPRGTRLPKDVVVEAVRRIGGIEPVFGAALVIAGVSFALMVAGLVVRASASFVPWVWLGVAGGAMEAAAIALFLVVMGKTLRASETKDPWDKFVYVSLACFLLSGLLEPVLYVAIFSAPSMEILIHRVATFQGPYRDIQVLGFAGLMILGVSQRILPTAFGFRAPGRLAGSVSFWLLTGGLALDIAGWLAFRATRDSAWAIASWGGGVLYAFGALWLVVAMRALGRGGSDRSTKFIRAAYFWLAVACVMIVAEPFYTRAVGMRFSHAFHGAIRHAFTVGFISLMILGVSSKVVPILRGIDLHGLPALWAPFLLINLGNTLRVGSQVATDLTARAFPILGVSGIFEVLGLALWGAHLWSLLGRQASGSTSGEITADSRAAAVIDAHAETLEVFEKFGFKELRNPILRNTIARRVSLRTPAQPKKVNLQAFLKALKEKAQ